MRFRTYLSLGFLLFATTSYSQEKENVLLESAVEAALKTVFPPFTLEGKPEKVSGVLVYKFVK